MANKDVNVLPASKKAGFNAADYNAVAMKAHLQAIKLLSQRFDMNVDVDQDPTSWKLSYGRKIVSCTFTQEQSSVAAIIQYEVTAKSGRKRAMHCTADYAILYSVPADSEEEAAKGFCRNVGTFAIYPYFRALVSQLAWNAELALPPLPSIASTAHIPPKKPSEQATLLESKP